MYVNLGTDMPTLASNYLNVQEALKRAHRLWADTGVPSMIWDDGSKDFEEEEEVEVEEEAEAGTGSTSPSLTLITASSRGVDTKWYTKQGLV